MTGTLLKENGYYLGAASFVDRVLGLEHPELTGHQSQIGIRENAAALLEGGLGPFQQCSKVSIHAKKLQFGGRTRVRGVCSGLDRLQHIALAERHIVGAPWKAA